MEEKVIHPRISISNNDLIPYIQKHGEALSEQVNEAREKYGLRYNDKNNVEELYRRFGNPMYEPEMFAEEYSKIISKASDLPATIRYFVRDFCSAAMKECHMDKYRFMCADIHNAQDGDMILGGTFFIIFNGIDTNKKYSETGNSIMFHAAWNIMEDAFYPGPKIGVGTLDDDIQWFHSTADQRDALLAKIKENGYEWDSEKKKLEKKR